jgi:amino acid permease
VRNKIIKIICMISSMLAFIYQGYIVLTNIDMTYTRLFITYWWQYLITIIIYIVSYSVYMHTQKNEFDKVFKKIIKSKNKGE